MRLGPDHYEIYEDDLHKMWFDCPNCEEPQFRELTKWSPSEWEKPSDEPGVFEDGSMSPLAKKRHEEQHMMEYRMEEMDIIVSRVDEDGNRVREDEVDDPIGEDE